jgi:hypothetical protein
VSGDGVVFTARVLAWGANRRLTAKATGWWDIGISEPTGLGCLRAAWTYSRAGSERRWMAGRVPRGKLSPGYRALPAPGAARDYLEAWVRGRVVTVLSVSATASLPKRNTGLVVCLPCGLLSTADVLVATAVRVRRGRRLRCPICPWGPPGGAPTVGGGGPLKAAGIWGLPRPR